MDSGDGAPVGMPGDASGAGTGKRLRD